LTTKKGRGADQSAAIEYNLTWLSDILVAQSENGLFERQKEVTFDQIEKALDAARKTYDEGKGNVNDSLKAIEECWKLVNDAINRAGSGYRDSYIHVTGLAALLGGIFITEILALAYFGSATWFAGVPYWAILIGSIGGCVRGFWWLYQHVDKMDFRRSWWYWFVVSPLVGAGLGVFTYFAVLAGVASTTSSATITQAGLTMFLVGFAGFNWKWAVQLFDNLAGSKTGTSATGP